MSKLPILLYFFLLLSCTQFLAPVPSEWAGKEAFTKHGFHHINFKHITTNYIKGSYISPGSKVKVMEVTLSTAKIMHDGNLLEIVNHEKYTNKTIEQILDRMLTSRPFTPDISPKFKVSLKTGLPSLGMTKTEVLTCIGYPPAHSTYDLNAPVWKYWFSKFDTKDLIFVGDKLESIRN